MSRRLLNYTILSFAILLGSLATANAQSTVTAASCSASDVQAAFNAVTSTTTTINIPAGTCAWSTHVALNIPSGSTSLSVIGAGNLQTVGGGDATVIVDNDSANSDYLLQVNTNSNTSAIVRLAGFTLEGGTGGYKGNGILAVNGDSHNFRLDHFHVNASTYSTSHQSAVVRITNWIYGVMDHSIFDGGSAIEVWMDQYGEDGNDGAGDGSWAADTNFGSGNAFFIEDNVFNEDYGQASQFMDDCYAGGRMVIRFNTMNNDDVMTHPTGGAGSIRGCRSMEIYKNTFNGSNSTPTTNVFWESSGTALVWGNSAPAGYVDLINLHTMRINNSTYPQTAPPIGWGYCGTNFNGTGSAWDQNSDATTGYRCIDEPGAGKSDLLEGWFPTMCDVTSGGCAAHVYTGTWPNQALEPIYEWLNTWDPVPAHSVSKEVDNTDAPSLTANVDWYQYTSSFNGTSGVGSGTYADMPSTCTKGVAYWATDKGDWNLSGNGGQGELYVCSATNTWSPYYTPYTYPYPLNNSTVSQSVPAPQDLQGSVVPQ